MYKRQERRRVIALTPAGADLRERAADIPGRMAESYPGAPRDLRELKAFLDDIALRLG